MPAIIRHRSDHALILTVAGLGLFGAAMVASSSSVVSTKIFGDPTHFLWQHIFALVAAGLAFAITQAIPYHFWQKIAVPALAVGIIGLFLPFLPGVGIELNGAHSWISVPLFGTVQPVEFAKIALVIYLAAWMAGREDEVRQFDRGFVPFAVLAGLFLAIIALQNDYGSLLVVTLTAGGMYYLGGANLTHFFAGGSIGMVLAYFVISLKSHVQARFLAFLNPDLDPQGIGWQIKQSLIAVGSGGWWGLGFGRSRQKYEYLPQAYSDSIFAVTGEELGFVRTVGVVAAFAFFAYRGFSISLSAADRFGSLLAGGITVWITSQAFLNVMTNLGLAPMTGVTLPFLSHGGSSLVALFAAVGILVNISRTTSLRPAWSGRRGER